MTIGSAWPARGLNKGWNRRSKLAVAALLLGVGAHPALGAKPPPSLAATAAALRLFPAGATLVAFDAAGGGDVWLATTVPDAPKDVPTRLANTASYTSAVPSFKRADTLRALTRKGVVEREVDWELEIPLWNLQGKLWLKSFVGAVQLRLTEGAFAPGEFLWRWSQPTAAPMTVTLHGIANTRDANWGTRLVAKRSHLAVPAMTVAAAYTMLQGMTAVIAKNGPSLRWPSATMQPAAMVSFAKQLIEARSRLAFDGPVGVVIRRPDGRLDHVEIAASVARPPASLLAKLADPQSWRALPGWKQITAKPAPNGGTTLGTDAQRWAVDATFPFFDFDATWDIQTSSALHATASDGDAKGAAWSWHAVPAGAAGSAAVFALYPRVERLGYMPRKFIDKEPLLESGLALSLAYVDAVSLLNAIGAGP